MNELIELLEMQRDLDNLIQEAVGELTVGEFQTLQESGVLNEVNLTKAVTKIGSLAKKASDAAKNNFKAFKSYTKSPAARNDVSALGVAGLAGLKAAKDSAKTIAKNGAKAVAGGAAVGATGAAAVMTVRVDKARKIYKETGNAVTACKALYKDPVKVKACAAQLYKRSGAGKIQKIKDSVKDKYNSK